MESTTRSFGRRLTAIREEVRDNRAARAAHRSLEKEIAAYTSESDLNDLQAILDRHSDEETREIRRIMARHRAA
jgi:hypothetical protein